MPTTTETAPGSPQPDGVGAIAASGLDDEAVRERIERGDVNVSVTGTSRSTGAILRANLLTWFNVLMGSLLAVVLVFGQINDALFGLVVVANALIGIVQELRAKRTLDRLALLSAPKAHIVRSGKVIEQPTQAVVIDDVLEIGAGDQVVVDATVLVTDGIDVDESLLTGESDTVRKHPGDGILSGSFVVAGSARIQATAVGAGAYANTLAASARRFTLVHSELRDGIQHLVRGITWVLLPTAALLFWTQLNRGHHDLGEAISGAVAGTVGMVPEGLVLLTSIAFTVGMLRLGRRGVLVQELPAVEGLARIDTLCIDKTGTLTFGKLRVVGVEEQGSPRDDALTGEALASLAAAEARPNATLAAIGEHFAPSKTVWHATERVPFSSARKWSGAAFDGHGTWLLGAPEVLLHGGGDAATLTRTEALAASGSRVVLLARTDESLNEDRTPDCEPVALVVLADAPRPEAGPALDYFAKQGVRIKVISGDNPATVAAVTREIGHPFETLDARELPADPEALADVVDAHDGFGRVTPEQKQSMVAALKARGHVVAMTGDGVNDVLALKDADMGIAMGNGSEATKGVAQLVLLDGDFSVMPAVVAEGRRVIANIERTGRLFLTKTTYAFVFAIVVTALELLYPFLPRHLTLVGQITIGIPGFFLALAPNAPRSHPGFVRRVLRFAVPAGLVLAALTTVAYVAVQRALGFDQSEARTVATVVLGCSGLFVLMLVARPLTGMRQILLWAMAGLFLLSFLVPPIASFYALDMRPFTWALLGLGLAGVLGCALLLHFAEALGTWLRKRR